jgi:hypothetical protein
MIRLASILCVLFAALCLAAPASAISRPHQSTGTAAFTGPSTFVGQGTATHLGAYTEDGTITLTPTDTPGVLSVTGSIIYTASNDDELHATFTGTLNALTGAISATITYTGTDSGRFKNASGSSDLTGQVQGDGTLAVKVSGAVDF